MRAVKREADELVADRYRYGKRVDRGVLRSRCERKSSSQTMFSSASSMRTSRSLALKPAGATSLARRRDAFESRTARRSGGKAQRQRSPIASTGTCTKPSTIASSSVAYGSAAAARRSRCLRRARRLRKNTDSTKTFTSAIDAIEQEADRDRRSQLHPERQAARGRRPARRTSQECETNAMTPSESTP